MKLKVKSIAMPPIWGEGSSMSVNLYLLDGDTTIGSISVDFPFSEELASSTITDLENAAIDQAKARLSNIG